MIPAIASWRYSVSVLAIACLAWGLGGISAKAQTVYRCGSTYAHAPCPEGRPVDVADPRDAAQVEQSRAQTARDKQLADALHRENAAREAAYRKTMQAEAKRAQKLAAQRRREERAKERARKAARKTDVRKAVSPKPVPSTAP